MTQGLSMFRVSLSARAFVALLWLGAAACESDGTEGDDDPVGDACTVGGETVASGTSGIAAPDGCNTCSCEDGQISCTEIACSDLFCTLEGERVPEGMVISRECNTCTCSGGALSCTEKACPVQMCAGIAGHLCGSGQYCDYGSVGACLGPDAAGVCRTRPGVCLAVENPVCGCDGKTYGNACAAAAAGADVAAQGACTSPDRLCGSRGLKPCAGDEYCAWEPSAQCGATDIPGVCRKRPEACPANFDPVCACDGKSYSNECVAAAAGAAVRRKGSACENQGRACGGFTGSRCAPGEYCDYGDGKGCGITDGTGICRETPSACNLIYAPVCGCDGKTYGNACGAASAGVSVKSTGECGASGQACVIDGVSFPGGSTVPMNCGSCRCQNGQLDVCTASICPAGVCTLDGIQYQDGATNVPDPESCNTCGCTNGVIGGACTKKACPTGRSCAWNGAYFRNGTSFELGSLECKCTEGKLSCAP